jgi:nucleoside-diphosphate-sugar epimerase
VIILQNDIPFEMLKNSTILVTGATGLIGSALVHFLENLNTEENLNINIIQFTRQNYGDIRNSKSFENIKAADFIFHCVSITKSAEMVDKPADVMSIALDGTKNILELAKVAKSKSVVYLSSMEVYGQIDGEVTEKDLGYLDLSNPRSSYPESKRACEMLCTSYYKQYGVPVKIARLAQTFGTGTPKTDTRVFAQFASSAMLGEDIVLHTEGKSVGNYCCISDAVSALFTLLLKGIDGEVYNIANPENTMTIREMAEIVAEKISDGKIKVVVNPPKDVKKLGYAAQTGCRLNIDKIRELGWLPKYTLEDMYKQMIDNWK